MSQPMTTNATKTINDVAVMLEAGRAMYGESCGMDDWLRVLKLDAVLEEAAKLLREIADREKP